MKQTVLPERWLKRDLSASLAGGERQAFGTSARVVVWPPQALSSALEIADSVIAEVDLAASRFRFDSELSRLNSSCGSFVLVSSVLDEALTAALEVAAWTDGMVDPTVGASVISAGYDRDFGLLALAERNVNDSFAPKPAPGWTSIVKTGRLVRLAPNTVLDLGATGKAFAADRIARQCAGEASGTLVSLGGDIATSGHAPSEGWVIKVAEDHRNESGEGDLVTLRSGALATSSTTCRTWSRGNRHFNHLIDPRTGQVVSGRWRSATVAGKTCVAANAAATAALVAGDSAQEWLATHGLSARLVDNEGGNWAVGRWPGSVPRQQAGS